MSPAPVPAPAPAFDGDGDGDDHEHAAGHAAAALLAAGALQPSGVPDPQVHALIGIGWAILALAETISGTTPSRQTDA